MLARDISEEKKNITEENICRMGAGNIEVQIFDGTCTDEALLEKADVLLLDVPCSGLGVMGKKRDIKYRVTKENLGALEKLQKQITAASAGYVKKGGTLLYSTCTIRREENEDMVRYIVRELGFAPVPLDGVLPEGVLAAKERLEEKMRVAGREACPGLTEEESRACIRLPGHMESDGFFIARFRRVE